MTEHDAHLEFMAGCDDCENEESNDNIEEESL